MNLSEWQSIPWQKRNEIIAFYGLRRSQLVKVRSIATGVDTIDDDGIRESDLTLIANLSVEDAIALKPLEVVVSEAIEVPKVFSEIPLEGKKIIEPKKVKKTKKAK